MMSAMRTSGEYRAAILDVDFPVAHDEPPLGLLVPPYAPPTLTIALFARALAGLDSTVQIAHRLKGTEMVTESKRHPLVNAGKLASFGSALDEGEFNPLGRRVKVKVGVDRYPLRMPAKPHGTAEQQK
ncbi:hypothetical protein [Pararhizobium sp. PWRC1-1]|uniref:hypothetical protein n=1 Tax=Pararhizobium sp. PWRC1-1 TaxID=2804566 RepID=UPI003CFB2FD7